MKADIIEENLYQLYHQVAELCSYPLNQARPFRGFLQSSAVWPNMCFIGDELPALEENDIARLAELIKKDGWSRTVILNEQLLDSSVQSLLRKIGFFPVSQWTNMIFLKNNDIPLADNTHTEKSFFVEELSDKTQLAEWLKVVENSLFNGRTLDENIFFTHTKRDIFTLLCVRIAGKIVATALVYLGKDAGVYMVATDALHRKKGLASALMNYAKAMVFQLGYDKLVLHSTKEGLGLYSSQGFQSANKLTLYYLKP